MMVKRQFDTQVATIDAQVRTVCDAVDEVMHSTILRNIFTLILELGNTMNAGTARGSAAAFKLETLNKLRDTKATISSSITLLHFLAEVVAEHMPDQLAWRDDMPTLEGAVRVSTPQLKADVASLSSKMAKLSAEVETSKVCAGAE